MWPRVRYDAVRTTWYYEYYKYVSGTLYVRCCIYVPEEVRRYLGRCRHYHEKKTKKRQHSYLSITHVSLNWCCVPGAYDTWYASYWHTAACKVLVDNITRWYNSWSTPQAPRWSNNNRPNATTDPTATATATASAAATATLPRPLQLPLQLPIPLPLPLLLLLLLLLIVVVAVVVVEILILLPLQLLLQYQYSYCCCCYYYCYYYDY